MTHFLPKFDTLAEAHVQVSFPKHCHPVLRHWATEVLGETDALSKLS